MGRITMLGNYVPKYLEIQLFLPRTGRQPTQFLPVLHIYWVPTIFFSWETLVI